MIHYVQIGARRRLDWWYDGPTTQRGDWQISGRLRGWVLDSRIQLLPDEPARQVPTHKLWTAAHCIRPVDFTHHTGQYICV